MLNHPALQARLDLEPVLDHRAPPPPRRSLRSAPPTARSPPRAAPRPPAPTAPPPALGTPPDPNATAPCCSPRRTSRPARTTSLSPGDPSRDSVRLIEMLSLAAQSVSV